MKQSSDDVGLAGPASPPEPESKAIAGGVVADHGAMVTRIFGMGLDGEVTSRIMVPCVIETLSCRERDGSRIWEIRIRRKGLPDVVADMHAETMEKTHLLNAWASGKAGGMSWDLDDFSRVRVKELILNSKGAKEVVREIMAGGYLRDYGVIVGHNAGIDSDGKYVPADKDGSLPLMCKDGGVSRFKLADKGAAPVLVKPEKDLNQARLDLAAYLEASAKNFGCFLPHITVGFFVAHAFRDDVYAPRRCFPHLYLFGRRQGGKDFAMGRAASLAGVGHISGSTIAGSTVKGLRSSLTSFAGWPFWVNDVRSDRKNAPELSDMVRTAFDGQGSVVATREGSTKDYTPRRAMAFTSEEIFGGDAERMRYVACYVDEKVQVRKLAPRADALMAKAQAAFVRLLQHRELGKHMAVWAQEYSVMLMEKFGSNERQAWCWGVALAGIRAATVSDSVSCEKAIPAEMFKEVGDRMAYIANSLHDENKLRLFMAAARHLHDDQKLHNRAETPLCRPIKPRGSNAPAWALNFRFLYNEVLARRGGDRLPSLDSLLIQLRSMDDVIDTSYVAKLAGKAARCVIVKEDSSLIDEWLRVGADFFAENVDE